MNIDEKIARSKSDERINFAKIGSMNQDDALVRVENSDKLQVEPVWTVAGDYEGRLYAGYIADHPDYDGVYVRSELLKRLEQAAASLDDKYKLVVRAGHRPIDIQKRLLRDVMADHQKEHPDANDEAALRHARMYVSDPAIKLPPHCCGAAVDVELYDVTAGDYVDFGGTLNHDHPISHLHSSDITAEQQANRLLLLTTMLNAGFASYYAEWWHYSYGDEIWAWFYSRDTCLYNLAEI